MKNRAIGAAWFAALLLSGVGCRSPPVQEDDDGSFLHDLRSRIPNNQWVAEKQLKVDVNNLLGAWKDTRAERVYREDDDDEETEYEPPASFDSRTKWENCKSISLVWDQANCGSCWAVSVAGAMSDRMCIHENAQILVSAENLMSCCYGLPLFSCGMGCNGGQPFFAWRYWQNTGIVNGGFYGSNDTCQPYLLAPCDHHVDGNLPPCQGTAWTPWCHHKCQDGYNGDYSSAKTHGKSHYDVPSKESKIMEEIQTNGPVAATLDVYEDFEYYKTGVYEHVKGNYLGGHAVRMIGWGESEEGVPYWLIVNSWNEDWGDKGLFKIKRGSDECGIEGGITAGLPRSL